MVARTIPHCAVTPKHVNKFSLTTNTALILKQSTIIFKKDLQTDFVVCNPCILRYNFFISDGDHFKSGLGIQFNCNPLAIKDSFWDQQNSRGQGMGSAYSAAWLLVHEHSSDTAERAGHGYCDPQ